MASSPNTSPAFIQTVGIVGNIVQLTNQVCTRDIPGTTPVLIYDSTASYAQGNGALVEAIRIEATGVTAASVLFLFVRNMLDANPAWRKIAEVTLPAVASVTGTAAIAGYPVYLPLPPILSPVPQAGTTSQFNALRLNGEGDTNYQWGVALGTSVGTAPINVVMYGGEY